MDTPLQYWNYGNMQLALTNADKPVGIKALAPDGIDSMFRVKMKEQFYAFLGPAIPARAEYRVFQTIKIYALNTIICFSGRMARTNHGDAAPFLDQPFTQELAMYLHPTFHPL